jgi:hypothetical protein
MDLENSHSSLARSLGRALKPALHRGAQIRPEARTSRVRASVHDPGQTSKRKIRRCARLASSPWCGQDHRQHAGFLMSIFAPTCVAIG